MGEREALEFAAQHLSSDWPERCQEIVRRARAALSAPQSRKLWLWQNFVDGRREYWAFDNPFPVHLDCGDPQTLGEPCGYALLKPSRAGRSDVTEDQVLQRIKRAREFAKPLSDELMDCVDRLGSEWQQVDPRVWDHLLVYAPAEKIAARCTPNAELLAERDAEVLYASPAPGELGAVASAAESDLVPQVRRLLWGEHPECCGSPVEVTEAYYMGRVETMLTCCGSPDYVRLNDAQIVASLRALLPESPLTQQAPSRRNQQENQMDTQSTEWPQLVELAAAHIDDEGDGPKWARLVAAIANKQAPSESSAQAREQDQQTAAGSTQTGGPANVEASR